MILGLVQNPPHSSRPSNKAQNKHFMKDRFRVLLIASNYFFPPTDGTTLRDYNMFSRFSGDFEFDLLTFGDEKLLRDHKNLARPLGTCFRGVRILSVSSLRSIKLTRGVSRFTNIFFPKKLTMGLPRYSNEMANVVRQMIDSPDYDLIYFCDFSVYCHSDGSIGQRPYIVDIQDSPTVLFDSKVRNQRTAKQKVRAYLNLLWARRYERTYFSKIKNMIFVSELDRAYVQKRCRQSNIWVVPNGVDIDYFKPKDKRSGMGNRLLFTGVMDYHPNHEAMVYFIREILPVVRSKVRDVSLTIAGKNPMPELQELASRTPDVKLTGFVKDMRPYFDDADVYISPLISGAGIKNKILEAWAMAKPAVASTVSCSGLEVRDGENIILADGTKRFSEEIVRLLKNGQLQSKLAREGRKTAEESYSWKRRAYELESVCVEVMKGRDSKRLMKAENCSP